MKRIVVIAFAASLAVAAPAMAQEDEQEGFSLMEEGAKLLFRGFMQEMEPALEDLRDFSEEIEPGLRKMMDEMGPAFAEILGKIDDISAYHPPEMLPNGDIILRRKEPLEPDLPAPDEGGEIEL